MREEPSEKHEMKPITDTNKLPSTGKPSHYHYFISNSLKFLIFFQLIVVIADKKEYKPYSPFHVPLKPGNLVQYALARLDDLVNLGRKVS